MSEKASSVGLTTPKNVAAERAVLAGIAQYGQESFTDIQDICSITSFYEQDNQIIYKCLAEVLKNSDRVDIASVFTAGTSLGVTESLNDKTQKDFIRSLFSFPIQKESVRKNAAILKKLEIARKGQTTARGIYSELAKVNGTESIDEILGKLEGPILDFSMDIDSEDNEKTELIWEGIDEFMIHLAENKGGIMGIPSPFARYNEAIGGGRRRGGVYLVGARPKAGKSTMAINDAVHVAGKLKIPVLYLDTEMTKEGQLPRLLSCLAKLNIKDIETGKFADNDFMRTKLSEIIADNREKTPIYYRKVSGKEFEEILSIIRRWVIQVVGQEDGRTKDCLVIYDYFKLMTPDSLEKMQEFQALGFQISALTDFCKKYDVPCASYVQLNRDGITKETSDIISQSDRLLWLATSFAILKRKTREEILLDGVENGNTKLIPTMEQRFGPGLEEGDYINLMVDRGKCVMDEGKTAFELKATQNNNMSGFDIVEDGNESEADEYDDDDFNQYNYGDDQYRKDGPLRPAK